MKVGIVGLGLIGGSLAKAYKESGQAEVYGWDTDADTMLLAKTVEAIDGTLDETVLPDCDLLLLALYPGANTCARMRRRSRKRPLSSTAVVSSRWSVTRASPLRSNTASPFSAGIQWREHSFPALLRDVAACSAGNR
mgnify:CR=1 FL=1